MSANDLVFILDQQQSLPTGARCKANPDHGRLGVHVSGAYLVCGDKKCTYAEPTSLPDKP